MVLYINLRDPHETNTFPLRDNIPADILAKNLNCSASDYSSRCIAFFTATFRTLKRTLISYGSKDTDRVVQTWNSRMCDLGSPSRATFFRELKNEYESVSRYLSFLTYSYIHTGLWIGIRF